MSASKKNEAVTLYAQQAILLVETQIELLKYLIREKTTEDGCKYLQGVDSVKLQWTGKAVELVELVYALHEAGKLGGSSLKEAFSVLGEVFGIEIKNHYRLFWDVKNRVKGRRTVFLDLLKTAIITLMEKSDRGKA
jgi:hypothetical protein